LVPSAPKDRRLPMLVISSWTMGCRRKGLRQMTVNG